MPGSVAVRAAVLAAVTLVAATLALWLTSRHDETSTPKLPAAAGPWHPALAAPYTPSRGKSACGTLIGPNTIGIAHNVLPCGVRIYVRFGDKQVLAQVIDRGPKVPGRDFDLTRALARTLGVTGTQTISWRFSR